MWHAGENFIGYQEGGDSLEFSLFMPDWQESPREIFSIPNISEKYVWYDDWVQRYSRQEEVDFVVSILASLSKNPRPIHIIGLTCSESWDIVAEYYRLMWYEHMHTRYFSLPRDVLLTVSISLEHLLWCEKDKVFLSKKEDWVPHYALVPPLRTPCDLRTIQQSARRGIILGVSVPSAYKVYLREIFEKQILTPFQLTQLLGSRWKQFWFTGTDEIISISFPDFAGDI